MPFMHLRPRCILAGLALALPAGPALGQASVPPPPPDAVPPAVEAMSLEDLRILPRGGRPDRERITPGGEDVGPLGTSQLVDLRVDSGRNIGFDTVYREGDLFLRSLGALTAVFPRSEYVSLRRGGTGAAIPAGTYFRIGDEVVPPEWTPRVGMINRRADGQIATDVAAEAMDIGPGPGAVRVDPWTGGRVTGTGLQNDARLQRLRLAAREASRNDDSVHGPPPVSTDATTAHAAGRPSDASLPERPRTGAASPPRPSWVPAIVEDAGYRKQRLRSILDRAVAGAKAARQAGDQAALGPSSSPS